MPDQADGLRELVANEAKVATDAHEETLTILTGKSKAFREIAEARGVTIFDLARGQKARADLRDDDPIDYRKLWQDFKAELEAERSSHIFDPANRLGTSFGSWMAGKVLDRMELAETFARVRHDLGGRD